MFWSLPLGAIKWWSAPTDPARIKKAKIVFCIELSLSLLANTAVKILLLLCNAG
jgi:hypothetical protein